MKPASRAAPVRKTRRRSEGRANIEAYGRGQWKKIAMNRFLRDNTDTRVMFQTAS
jgi:hypothetical protein